MDSIQESGNSIFYIADQTKIIEYNLLSKRKQVIHANTFEIGQYLITNKHKSNPTWGDKIVIPCYCRDFIYWNDKQIKIENNYIYRFTFLSLGNEIYIYSQGRNSNNICNQKIIITERSNEHYSSYCGKRLMIAFKGHWYIKNTPSRIEDLFKINQNNIFFDFTSTYMSYWIDNSNVLIKNYFAEIIPGGMISRYKVYNIETQKWIHVPYESKLFDAVNFLILQIQQTVEIRDIKTMDLISTIHFPKKIIFYHKQLELAITQDLDYYKLRSTLEDTTCRALRDKLRLILEDTTCRTCQTCQTCRVLRDKLRSILEDKITKFELQKINLGINYNEDMIICPNQIMDVIIENNLIDIPNDILYCELYQLLIQYIP